MRDLEGVPLNILMNKMKSLEYNLEKTRSRHNESLA
jgi:hypothetical protein